MSYQINKERIRNEAIDFQSSCYDRDYSYMELLNIQTYFEKQGRRYGLLKEFRENGII